MQLCGICSHNESKYKCPKCTLRYCSVACFKNENHIHNEEKVTEATEESRVSIAKPSSSNKWEIIANDPIIRSMLNYDSLKFHLSVIQKILNEPSLTGITNQDGRCEVANMKLTNLRLGGSEANELVEDFCSRVLQLSREFNS